MTKNEFRLIMTAKVDDLTDFQTMFLRMTNFICEEGLAEKFMDYMDKEGSDDQGE